MLILSILYLKAYPDSDLPLDYFPADLAGKLIVQSALEAAGNSDINMVNTAGISINQVSRLIMEQGIQLEKLSYDVQEKNSCGSFLRKRHTTLPVCAEVPSSCGGRVPSIRRSYEYRFL